MISKHFLFVSTSIQMKTITTIMCLKTRLHLQLYRETWKETCMILWALTHCSYCTGPIPYPSGLSEIGLGDSLTHQHLAACSSHPESECLPTQALSFHNRKDLSYNLEGSTISVSVKQLLASCTQWTSWLHMM